MPSGVKWQEGRGHMAVDLLDGLNSVQSEAVTYLDGPLLILAGAGSGKTRVLTHKIAYLIRQQHIPAQHILAMTFTNKAAEEMRTRVVRLLGGGVEGLWIGTFHSLFARILRRHAQMLGYTSDFTIYDRDDSLALLKKIGKQYSQSSLPAMRDLLAFISQAKSTGMSVAEIREQEHLDPLYREFYIAYEEQLEASNALDFDDLLIKPLQLFGADNALLEHYRNYFQYVLIDEYQDTNQVQFRLARLLATPRQQLCVVGDEDQSIYGWRGADIGNILSFNEHFPSAKTIRLEENYRSFSHILAIANSVVTNNSSRLGKTLFSRRGEGSKPQLFACGDAYDEARRILKELRSERQSGYKLGQMAILYRTNAHARIIEEMLRKDGISYTIIGGLRFYERREVRDAVAYLRLLVNPRDEQAFRRAMQTPRRGVGDKTLNLIIRRAQTEQSDFFTAIAQLSAAGELSAKAAAALADFSIALRAAMQANRSEKLSLWVEKYLQHVGLFRYFEEIDSKEVRPREDEPLRVDNLYALLDTIGDFARRNGEETMAIAPFLQEVQLQTDIDRWNSAADRITLMTIHQAKGLEFPIVFIAGLEQGLLPLSRDGEVGQELEEERRLFYVAATRAEEKLYMTYARRRMVRGNEMFALPSQFIDEMDAAHYEHHGVTPAKARRLKAPADEPYYDFDDPLITGKSAAPEMSLEIGDEVIHPTFGQGKITNVEGFGDYCKITVLFYDGNFSKKLVQRFAKLVRL
jgi:DNA helicase-2/ATP-dependent DNA helicase PcrA